MKTETLLRGTIVAVTLTLFCVSVYYSKEHIQFDEDKVIIDFIGKKSLTTAD